ncbi:MULTISPECIES: hypothetical protein [unclassified Pseudomonas]|jgi:hypothetical protein|uniref:hypothetical protein n=1 Tax=unclassified Pseudomonas TaxID=196821 RepID=UPI0012FF24A2|nr:hypothetical protein [Pseudomonas sp. H1h]
MSYIKPVRRLRASFFGHALTVAAGCAATGPGLSRWGDAWWAKRRGRAMPETLNHKWPDYLTGSFPRQALRTALIEDFPCLQSVLDDPLWPLLQRLVHPHEDTGCWAAQLRLNQCPFRYFSAARLMRLCGIPDWRRLAGLLALMGSERPCDARAQSWLRAVFTHYVLCVCLDLPGQADPLGLYRILEAANRLDKFGPLSAWPNSPEGFQRKLYHLKRLRARLQARGWMVGWAFRERLLFWHLLWDRPMLARLLSSAAVELTRRDLISHTRHRFRQAQRDRVSFTEVSPEALSWCDPARGNTLPYGWNLSWGGFSSVRSGRFGNDPAK